MRAPWWETNLSDRQSLSVEFMEITGMGEERTGERENQRDVEREGKKNKKETERNKKDLLEKRQKRRVWE